jgi:hypothetical protein
MGVSLSWADRRGATRLSRFIIRESRPGPGVGLGRCCAWLGGFGIVVGSFVGGWGRLPLDTDQAGEPAIEWRSWLGVGGPVGSAEHSGVGWSGDMPVFFVDQPMMNPT